MSKLSKADRDKLPEGDFGDASRRLFPVVDQDDVDSAARLIGKAKDPEAVKARIIAIAKRKGLKIPEAWKAKADMNANPSADGKTATTSLALFEVKARNRKVEGDYAIYGDSLLFRAGDYPDKGIAVSPEDLWLNVEGFTPVSGNIEHTKFMQGKACELRSIRLDETDSSILRGEVAVPLWLDAQLGDHERKVSTEWDIPTRTLTGLALCVHPRIPEAALMAAFAAAHRTSHGSDTIQIIHDQAARSGAICDPVNNRVGFTTARERSGLQKLHDTAVEHGASCRVMTGKASYTAAGASATTATLPPVESPDVPFQSPTPTRRAKPMSWRARLAKALFGGADGEESIPDDQAEQIVRGLFGEATKTATKAEETTPAPATSATTATLTADQANFRQVVLENERLKTEREETRVKSVRAESASFAERMVAEGRIAPVAKNDLANLLAQLAEDDHADGETAKGRVGFTLVPDKGNPTVVVGSRSEAAKALLSRIVPHRLTADLIDPKGNLKPGTQFLAPFAEQPSTEETASPQELARLLRHLPGGETYAQKVLAGANGNGR